MTSPCKLTRRHGYLHRSNITYISDERTSDQKVIFGLPYTLVVGWFPIIHSIRTKASSRRSACSDNHCDNKHGCVTLERHHANDHASTRIER